MKNESILDTTKKLCLIDPSDLSFDMQICSYINSVFVVLHQIGALDNLTPVMGPAATWGEYFTDDVLLMAVISYVSAKVKMKFDPPAGSSAMDALMQTIAEDEWRINSLVDYKPESTDGEEDKDNDY